VLKRRAIGDCFDWRLSWSSGATTVGSSGANATLRIENGGTMTNGSATSIGVSAVASNNL